MGGEGQSCVRESFNSALPRGPARFHQNSNGVTAWKGVGYPEASVHPFSLPLCRKAVDEAGGES